jgi:ferric-dicitrate binding protein FerR (iron transport regulator)
MKKKLLPVTGRKIREVKLEGEAFFDVAKKTGKQFEVNTGFSTVTVLGNSFNVFTDSLQSEISVSSVKVEVRSVFSEEEVLLLPDDKVVFTRDDLVKSQITNPNYLSWKTGVFLFEDTPLPTVVNDLNRYYPKPIQLKGDKTELLFSAKFDQAKQEDIIEIIKITFNLNITENNKLL